MVASTAGVSAPTVSKVLNGRMDVSPATRARVEQAIRDLDYVPVAGRGLPEFRTVEIVFGDLLNSYATQIMAGAIEAGLAANLTIAAKRYADAAGPDWAHRVKASGRDGIITVTSLLTPAQITMFQEAHVPIVAIDAIVAPRADLASIGATNFTGGYSATEYLVGLGHRRIAHLGGPLRLPCCVARLHGYRAAMTSGSLPVCEDLVAHGPFHYDTGCEQGVAWLDRPDPPTAIFAGSDQIALGVLEAARRSGLRVPGDLSVVGFDDTFVAELAPPPLTTVHQPLHEMGALAVKTLMRLAAGEHLDSHHVELATRLVVRGSSGPPPTGHARHATRRSQRGATSQA